MISPEGVNFMGKIFMTKNITLKISLRNILG